MYPTSVCHTHLSDFFIIIACHSWSSVFFGKRKPHPIEFTSARWILLLQSGTYFFNWPFQIILHNYSPSCPFALSPAETSRMPSSRISRYSPKSSYSICSFLIAFYPFIIPRTFCQMSPHRALCAITLLSSLRNHPLRQTTYICHLHIPYIRFLCNNLSLSLPPLQKYFCCSVSDAVILSSWQCKNPACQSR